MCWIVCLCVCLCLCARLCVGRGSLNYHHLQRVYVLPTGNLMVDLSHINVGEFSAELEIAQDIRGSAFHILNALPKLRYHDLIVVDNLRLKN